MKPISWNSEKAVVSSPHRYAHNATTPSPQLGGNSHAEILHPDGRAPRFLRKDAPHAVVMTEEKNCRSVFLLEWLDQHT